MSSKIYFSKEEISDLLDIEDSKSRLKKTSKPKKTLGKRKTPAETLDETLKDRRVYDDEKYDINTFYSVIDALIKKQGKSSSKYDVRYKPTGTTYFIRKGTDEAFFRAAEFLNSQIKPGAKKCSGQSGSYDGSIDLEFQWPEPPAESAGLYVKSNMIIMRHTIGYATDKEDEMKEVQGETINRVEKHNQAIMQRKQSLQPDKPIQYSLSST